jgi:hypothetical protein
VVYRAMHHDSVQLGSGSRNIIFRLLPNALSNSLKRVKCEKRDNGKTVAGLLYGIEIVVYVF